MMREIFNDFMKLERHSDGSVRIPLGAEQITPDLAGLTDGERVQVIYPGELIAEACVEHEQSGDWTLWYALLPSMDAIQDIQSDDPAEQAQSEQRATGTMRM